MSESDPQEGRSDVMELESMIANASPVLREEDLRAELIRQHRHRLPRKRETTRTRPPTRALDRTPEREEPVYRLFRTMRVLSGRPGA